MLCVTLGGIQHPKYVANNTEMKPSENINAFLALHRAFKRMTNLTNIETLVSKKSDKYLDILASAEKCLQDFPFPGSESINHRKIF